MALRFAIAFVFLALSLFGFSLTKPDATSVGSLTRPSVVSQIPQNYYASVFTTPVSIVTPAPPSPTPVPTATPPTPTPTPKSEGSSSSGSPIFLIFLVIIFGGIVLAVVASTIRVGRNR